MLEVRRRLDLGQEPLGTDDCCEFGLQHLQRDFTFVLDVVGQVDGGHAALTKLTLDAVAAFEGRVQAGREIRRLVIHAGKMRRRSAEREQNPLQQLLTRQIGPVETRIASERFRTLFGCMPVGQEIVAA